MIRFYEDIMNLLIPPLAVLWGWSIVAFTRWRLENLARKGGEPLCGMDDWAVQLFVRGTALLFLLVIVVLSFWS
ncbi:MAG: hypothetical protein C4520_14190 [Candidatus Abyssobacteria bacterium SURF_5]|uniref:Uncharacterized protein n=1 Tax=Abyssobacteria bacterium (strain SURF_5) TaxID=2093360 RepID=A0A3A4NHA7_ABYX5|nr:MAG: hypothetical protein C4520_14190 [Candidatus Abyssubacteria bacterium SURF_5]